MKFAAQTIIFGREFCDDYRDNLAMLKHVGFQAFETGWCKSSSVNQNMFINTVETLQLVVSGLHVGTSTLTNIPLYIELCEHARKLRCRNLVVSGILFGGRSREYYVRTARLLDASTEIARRYGLQLHYHHHDWELTRHFDRRCGLDINRENTDSGVCFILDSYWIERADVRFSDLWPKYRERCKIIHIKDGNPTRLTFTPLGKGQCDISKVIDHIGHHELDYIVWEQDRCGAFELRDCVESSMKWLAERYSHYA